MKKNSMNEDFQGTMQYLITKDDKAKSIAFNSKSIIDYVEKVVKEKNIKIKSLMIEPGRSIIASPGYTLYSVGNHNRTAF